MKRKQKVSGKKMRSNAFIFLAAVVVIVFAALVAVKSDIFDRYSIRITTEGKSLNPVSINFYKDNNLIKSISASDHKKSENPFRGKETKINEVNVPALSPKEKYVAVASVLISGNNNIISTVLAMYDAKGNRLYANKSAEYERFRYDASSGAGCIAVSDNGNAAFILENTAGCEKGCPNVLRVFDKTGYELLQFPDIKENYIYNCYSMRFSPNGSYFSVSGRETTFFFNLYTGRKWKSDYGKPVDVISLGNKGNAQFIVPK